MDTYGGQSGSAVWLYDGTNRYILTVHAYGDDGSGSNSGTRFNTAKFNDIINIMNGAAPPTDKADLTDDGQTWSGFSPTTVKRGQTSFTVWCDVRNFGTASSGDFYVDYYASTNTIISTADYLIGWDYISNVNAFAYADSDWTGTFPSSVPVGTYWIGWIIDSLSYVPEFDENNNIAYKNSYQLNVGPATYTLTIQVSGSGTTIPAVGTYTYNAGTNVQVTANPSAGWKLDHWELDGSNVGSANPYTVTMNNNHVLKAVFTQIGPSFKIWTDKTTYHIGETMKVYVRVKNPGTALPVRAKIFLKLPNGSLYGPLLDMTTTLPANYDSGDVLWKSFTIPNAPVGNYSWIAELRNPTTGALISQDIWNWQLLAAFATQTQTANVILQAKTA
jgi:hypothetical protein